MLAQGYNMKATILYQDNESTIKLINNGRRSSSCKTKHIDNRYFYVHDKVQKGEIIVSYLPSKKMWADGLSKPLSRISTSHPQYKYWNVMGSVLGRIFLAELHLRISEQDRSSSTTRRRRYVNHDTMLKDHV